MEINGITDADYAASVAAEEAEASELWERPIMPDSGPYRNHGVAVNHDHPLARGLQFAYIEPLGRYALECN